MTVSTSLADNPLFEGLPPVEKAKLLAELVERRYAPGEPLAGVIRPEAVSRLVAEHRSGRADHKSVLYCLLELSEWHRAFIEGAVPSVAL